MRVERIDFGEMKRPEKTAQGYLKADCFATRVGVFLYANADGTVRRELRPADEVFAEESLQTLRGVTVTDEHPPVLLNALNTEMYSKGFTGETVERVNEFVRCNITVTAQDLIAKLENREKLETSCGYTCDLEESAGMYDNQPYDAIQKNVRYNHLAVVSQGRAGPEVRVRMDGGAAVQMESQSDERVQTMAKIRVDDIELEVSEAAAMAVTTKFRKDAMSLEEIGAQLAALQTEVERLKGENTGLQAEVDSKVAEVDAMKGEIEENKMDAVKLDALVKARTELLERASVLAPDTKFDGLSEKEIKVACITARLPETKLDGVSDAFIDGLFAGITSVKPSTNEGLKNAINNSRVDNSSAETARARSMKADAEAWKINK